MKDFAVPAMQTPVFQLGPNSADVHFYLATLIEETGDIKKTTQLFKD